ncbi:MAG: TnsA endonuclease N-terminal domain-containing protein [Reinekea sp.]|nr:TnsA endonuclease N-terminal domain-containing protein [Reinekea sp.]
MSNAVTTRSLSGPLCCGMVQRDCRFPRQHIAKRGFQKSVNWFEQQFHKHKDVCVFHSLWELYYGVLLEIDPKVTAFVPQPFLFQIGKFRYTPDFHLERQGHIYIVEIKRDQELNEDGQWNRKHITQSMFDYCAVQGWTFKVIANSWLKKQQILVERWLPIIRCLQHHKELITDQQEITLLTQLNAVSHYQLQDVINPMDRKNSLPMEIALYRLALRGQISLDIQHTALSPQSRIMLQ